jgi:hypothetical protein
MKRRRSPFPAREFLQVRPIGDLVKSKEWDLAEHLDFINLWASEYALTHGKVPCVTEADQPGFFWVHTTKSMPPGKWAKADFNREFTRLKTLPIHHDTLHLPPESKSAPVLAHSVSQPRKRFRKKKAVSKPKRKSRTSRRQRQRRD